MKHLPTLYLTSCLLLLCLTTMVTAQTPISLGFQAGVNFANATTSPNSISTTSRTGLMIGGLLEIGISDVIFIQPEVLYVQKGAEFEVAASGTSAKATFKFDYFEIPILLKAKFGTAEFKPFIFGGPNIGINTTATVEATAGGQSASQDVKDQIESTDFALDFGAGGEYSINPTTALCGSIRYSLGLSDVDKDATSSLKSTGVQILFGVKFAL